MAEPPTPSQIARGDHQNWVQTRLLLERAFQDAVRYGFALIATGFGSFAVFDGLATNEGREAVPKAFALGATAIGVIVILLAAQHFQQMTAWADADEFGAEAAPKLPQEKRLLFLAAAAVIIGIISFIALLRLP